MRSQTEKKIITQGTTNFLNKNHFAIFKVEKMANFHYSKYCSIAQTDFEVFQLLEHLIDTARFL